MASWFSSKPADPAAAAKKREEKEAKAVRELRALLEQSPEGATAAQQLVQGGELRTAEECTSDAYLRRWLFAREWDVPLTHACIIKHAGWRAHVMPHGHIEEEWIEVPLARETIYLQGVDSLGRALAIVRVHDHVADKRGVKAMKLFTCYTMNAMVALCDPSLNPRGRLVSMFDMTGASYANMDVAAMRMILGLLGQHYVERLDALYFFNPPSVFFTLWNSLKGLLPEVTRSKIKVIAPSDLSELQQAVPPEVLPEEYGGRAALLPIRDAVRRFKLPPYPHLPELRAARAAAAAAAATAAAADEAGGQAGQAGDAVSVASEAPSADDSSGPNALTEEELYGGSDGGSDVFADCLEEFADDDEEEDEEDGAATAAVAAAPGGGAGAAKQQQAPVSIRVSPASIARA